MPQKQGNNIVSLRENKDLSILVVVPIENLCVREVEELVEKIGFSKFQYRLASKETALKLIALQAEAKSRYDIILSHENNNELKTHPHYFIQLPYNNSKLEQYIQSQLNAIMSR